MTGIAPTLSESAVATRMRAWLKGTLLYMQADSTLQDDDALLAGGIIDSMGVIELVEFLQETFEIAIGDQEITEHNLGSIQSIARFVSAKAQCATASLATGTRNGEHET